MKRRNFMQWIGLSGGALWSGKSFLDWMKGWNPTGQLDPLVVSTWNFTKANRSAWELLKTGARALDVVELGLRVEEANPTNMTVGYGGRPDREGTVTLDAAIMDEEGRAGSVAVLRDIQHPVSVARKVMEKTPHVMLSGRGAQDFALSQGFEREDLLSPEAKRQYKVWLKQAEYKPQINIEQHDTIGMIALDAEGNLSAACSTSGLAYKMPGRVSDSCLIGSGIYLDPEAGAAVATGHGEHIIKTAGTFLAVEEMRRGADPETACKRSLKRIYKRTPQSDYQAALLACDSMGRIGGYSMKPGFSYVISRADRTQTVKSDSLFD